MKTWSTKKLYHRDPQLWYKLCFHLTLFKKVKNFIVLQHSYHRRIIQQAGDEKRLHHRFVRRAASDEEHIITAGWWCKPAMMMDYHFRWVMWTSGDTYQCQRSFLRTGGDTLIPPVVIKTAVIEAFGMTRSAVVYVQKFDIVVWKTSSPSVCMASRQWRGAVLFISPMTSPMKVMNT